jgi:hypothetical protein
VRNDRRIALLLGGLLGVLATIALAQSWARWLDPIIDTGRDLYIPEQLTHGAKLYRDIRYQYPPLAPYLLAAITRIIGSSLASYTAIGIAQSLLAAALLWFIAKRAAGNVAAFTAAAMFVCANVAGASTWGANWIFPYTYAATIGMVALLALVAALRERTIAIAVVAALVASWCKVEYAIAVVLIVGVCAIVYRIRVRWFVAAGVVSAAFVALLFGDIRENVFNTALTKGASAKRFYSMVSGTAEWPQNIGTALVACAALVAIVLLLRARRWKLELALLAVAISLCFVDHTFTRAFAIVQWGALAWALARDRESPLALFATASIASTLRIALNVSPVWYGFVLVVPTYLLIAYLLFEYLPSRGVYTHRAALLWLPLIALVCGRELWQQHDAYASKRFPIVSMRGRFYDHNADRAAAISSFLASAPRGTLVVFPEGITLNYLAGLRTPLTFHTFTPVETASAEVEQRIIAELNAHPPDHIVIVNRDVREYGYRGFAIDYEQRVFAWIAARYIATERSSQMLVLARR